MRAKLFACILMCTAYQAGCDSSNGSQRVPDQPVGPGATTPQASAFPSGPQYADRDLPVAPDFEAEADEQITEDNYEAELAVIEQEMGVDAGPADGGKAAAADAGATPPASATAQAATPPPKPPLPAPKKPPRPTPPPKKPPAPKPPASDDAYD